MNSGTVWAGIDGITSMTKDARAMLATGAMSRMKATSVGLCQQERGTHSLHSIFMSEDGKEDAIHARDVLERTHGPGASSYFPEAPFDRIGRSHAAPLGLRAIAKTCQ